MILVIICAVALVGAGFVWSSQWKQKERVSLDPPLFTLSKNGRYVLGFALVFAAVCAATAFYLNGKLF